MKSKIILTTLLSAIIVLPIFSQRMPEILAIRNVEIQEDVDEIAVQNAYKDHTKKMTWYFLGNSAFLGKGNKGERVDKYIFLWGFDLKDHRDYYYPPDSTSGTAAALEAWGKIGRTELPYIKESPAYTDYQLLGFSKMIDPQLGEVVAIRYPDIIPQKEKEFQSRIENEWYKKCENLIEGVGTYFYKGDRGERKGKYMHVLTIDTYETYIKLWKKEGGYTEEGNKVFEPVKEFHEEMMSYFKEGSFGTYTDYIIIR
ncbi:hypothetical protein ACFLU5_00490 [Bacteroidota bacterium]